LISLPDNPAGRAAWQAYLALDAPVSPGSAKLDALRTHYIGKIGSLIEAARWAENPIPIAHCQDDPDRDGQAECMLANERVFTLFELEEGGYLAYGFVITEDGDLHQFTAPSSQMITGASSDASWDMQRGLLADPAVLPGAFFESASPTSPLPDARASTGLNSLTLTYSASESDREIHKTFTLLPGGISVDYTATPPGPLTTQVNLTIDPWLRFNHGWQHAYQFDSPTPGRILAATPGLQVEMKTDASLTLDTFLDTRQALNRPEDPNQEHPPGHYLPFPVASVKLSTNGDFSLQIVLSAPAH
jgi:hypothetical protein